MEVFKHSLTGQLFHEKVSPWKWLATLIKTAWVYVSLNKPPEILSLMKLLVEWCTIYIFTDRFQSAFLHHITQLFDDTQPVASSIADT